MIIHIDSPFDNNVYDVIISLFKFKFFLTFYLFFISSLSLMFGVELFNFNLVLLVLELFLFFWYDSNPIRTCINEEIKTSDQIPLKSNFRHGWQRRLSIKTFKKEICSRRNNVEIVFSVIKRT